MGALVGFIVGYVVGARQGPEGYARLREAIGTILESSQFAALIEQGHQFADTLTSGAGRNGHDGHDGHDGAGRAGAPDLAGGIRALVEGNGQLAATWRTIADSQVVQNLVATGLSFAGDLFDRGKAMLEERRK
ncbi:MAG TPA: hypothetical protein VKB80_17280 [Kofleriaceae bacterium]|nr:hypothetical protein [Kofleriaceae bacterium]